MLLQNYVPITVAYSFESYNKDSFHMCLLNVNKFE